MWTAPNIYHTQNHLYDRKKRVLESPALPCSQESTINQWSLPYLMLRNSYFIQILIAVFTQRFDMRIIIIKYKTIENA